MTELQQAQALVDELLQAARAGRLIPVRLPAQIEAIQDALNAAGEAAKAAAAAPPPPPAAPFDMEAFWKDQGYFISHAVHELRTPMTSIRGYSDMLPAMGELSDMQKQFVETIRTNARRMEGLLQDVTDMNKLRAGTLKVSPKMDMFKNIAGMTEKIARSQAEAAGKTFTMEIPQGLPLLNIDGELLAKALTKLAENAVRYTREGGHITLSAAAEGNRLTIRLKDDGIGMTPEEVAQLGTVYFRSDSETVRSFKGSGLGIPIAFGLIKLLDGTVTTESQPDQGTTFTITLHGMT